MLKKEILFTLIMKNYMRNVIFVNLFKKIFADHNTNLSLFKFLFIFYYHINGP